DVQLPPRAITIHGLKLLDCDGDSATFEVHCSKGTYIRSLARDIARALDSRGHVRMLQRSTAGAFTLDDAMALDKCLQLLHGARPQQALLPLTAGLDDIPVIAVDPASALALQRGQRIGGPDVKTGQYIATCGSVPVALVRIADNDMQVVRGFNFD
ncbi:MAG: hypothetical protein WDA25_11395, partial [Paracoccaceae bacterium]